MFRIGNLLRGITLNWLAMAVTAGLAFFLSPFVVHHLGNEIYGLWVLVGSAVSYMALLDLGFRGAVTRFISQGLSLGDHDVANEFFNAAVWFRLRISICVLAISVLLAIGFPHLFHVPSEVARIAQLTVLVTGLTATINLFVGVFGGVVAALHRFDLLSSIEISQALLRAAGFVVILERHGSILQLAMWDFLLALFIGVATVFTSFKVYPKLQLRLLNPNRQTLKDLWGYSAWVVLINVAAQVIYYTDNVVIGALLGATAVTFYAVGANLLPYMRQIVGAMTSTFTPLASSFDAEKNKGGLQELLVQGTRASLMLALPVAIGLFLRGGSFVGLWMGKQYAVTSGSVIKILVIGHLLSLANATGGGIAYGTGNHKRIAQWAIGEAVANLVLSLTLINFLGILGVAWGTTIPSVITNCFLWPPYISQLAGLRLSDFVRRAWVPFVPSAVLFSAGCWVADAYWPAGNILGFLGQMLLLVSLFVAPLLYRFRTALHRRLQSIF